MYSSLFLTSILPCLFICVLSILYHYFYFLVCFFFFNQKTAYEIRLSLVGSEMCIRDSFDSEGTHCSGENDHFQVVLNEKQISSKKIDIKELSLIHI